LRVRTDSGALYLVNLDMMELCRSVDAASGAHDDPVADLRKDDSVLTLLSVERCRNGRSAVFVLTGVADDPNTVTFRQTTPVTTVEPANPITPEGA